MSIQQERLDSMLDSSATGIGGKGGLTLAVPGEPSGPPPNWDDSDVDPYDGLYENEIFEFQPNGPGSYECFYGPDARLAARLMSQGLDLPTAIAAVIAKEK